MSNTDQLISFKLLFKNKLFVSILGLYAGASLAAWFSQAGDINSMIAKAINKSSFVILSDNFNENGSHKCASFKKCLDLGLVNFLSGCLHLEVLVLRIAKVLHESAGGAFESLLDHWESLDADKTLPVQTLLNSGADLNHVHLAFFSMQKLYCASSLLSFCGLKSQELGQLLTNK
ncbi:hypothetical protein G9A89_003261 [Geosiphon pyriformis]|nr:hypothetical protein G9A89_003261 [Geosiphon pyriformis]